MSSSSEAEKIGLILGKELQSGDNYLCREERSKEAGTGERDTHTCKIQTISLELTCPRIKLSLFASVSLRFIIDLTDLSYVDVFIFYLNCGRKAQCMIPVKPTRTAASPPAHPKDLYLIQIACMLFLSPSVTLALSFRGNAISQGEIFIRSTHGYTIHNVVRNVTIQKCNQIYILS